ncbi:MAG TPA: 50S ribosomal protein L9, partial [Gaiellaceae bacterium]|nr:50S ribosomal protein L9 [Gaiellaceae bacterium]
ILLQDVDKLGLRGDVVSVSRGYMRNFLRPRRLAEEATTARVAQLERREAERARHEARTVEQAEGIAEALRKTVLRFEVNAGPRGTLFGSVTATDVADEIWRTRKIRVDRRKIDLGDPIKRIGRYELPIALFEDVRVEVKTLVVPVGGELPPEEELEQMAAEEAAEEAAAAAEAQPAEEPVEYLDEEEEVGVPEAEEPREGEAPVQPVSEEEAVGVPDAAAEPEPGEGAPRRDEL